MRRSLPTASLKPRLGVAFPTRAVQLHSSAVEIFLHHQRADLPILGQLLFSVIM